MRRPMIALVCALLAAAGCKGTENPTAPTPPTEQASSPPPPAPKPPDTVAETHLLRQTFDAAYARPHDEASFLNPKPPAWAEWEDVYFEREAYRAKLESLVAERWAIGPYWWQASVRVKTDGIKRGGPIRFVVDYPWIDFRDDLVLEVSKPRTGTLARVTGGKFVGPRFSYLAATGIMLLIFAILGMLAFVAGKILWKFANWLVGTVAEWMAPGRGQELWVRRFVACLLGAAVCLVTFIIAIV